jgi:hypothetical protein
LNDGQKQLNDIAYERDTLLNEINNLSLKLTELEEDLA